MRIMSKLLVNAVTERTEGPELPGHMVSPAHPLLILQDLAKDCGNSVHHKLIRIYSRPTEQSRLWLRTRHISL